MAEALWQLVEHRVFDRYGDVPSDWVTEMKAKRGAEKDRGTEEEKKESSPGTWSGVL